MPGFLPLDLLIAAPGWLDEAMARLKASGFVVVLVPRGFTPGGLPEATEAEWTAAAQQFDPTGFLLRRRIGRAMAERYLGIAADSLGIASEQGGRPFLSGGPFLSGKHDLHLNFSARDGHSLVAMATGPIGVDFEGEIPQSGIAWNILRKEEAKAIRQAPVPGEAFLALWTRKEAIMKLIGSGFAIAPEQLFLEDDGTFRVEPPAPGFVATGHPAFHETDWQDGQGRRYRVVATILPNVRHRPICTPDYSRKSR